jgi:hypothetical protein
MVAITFELAAYPNTLKNAKKGKKIFPRSTRKTRNASSRSGGFLTADV